MGRILWRGLKTGTPTNDDFLSQRCLGLPCRNEAMLRERAEGISVFDSPLILRKLLTRFPALGKYMVALDVPEDGTISYAQTGANEHHFTIYEPPHRTLPLIVPGSIRPVEDEK